MRIRASLVNKVDKYNADVAIETRKMRRNDRLFTGLALIM